MASTYKYFSNNDRVVTTNNLTEEISFEDGDGWLGQSYAPHYFKQYASENPDHISTWALGTRVFDITFGRSTITDGLSPDQDVEENIYNQFAKVLLGYNANGSIRTFNLDPSTDSSVSVLHNAFFVNFCRSQFKDKIKQGSFELTINVDGTNKIILVDDKGTGPRVKDCPTGQFGLLYITEPPGQTSIISTEPTSQVQGLIFYEAGIAVISPYVFSRYNSSVEIPSSINAAIDENKYGALATSQTPPNLFPLSSPTQNIESIIFNNSIEDNSDALAKKIESFKYQATTELNSSIYFCRAFNHEFNYSSNPTYLDGSKIVVKNNNPEALPVAYITTVGLYNEANQLLAVAKLSEPVKKTPENELIARVRLDF